MQDSGPQPRTKHRPSFLLPLLSAGAFVLILAFIVYLADQVKDLSQSLEHSPPDVQRPGTNGFGIDTANGQTLYVPVYSHIYAGGSSPLLLETTLSVRNTDPENSIVLLEADYYDTQGELVERYIEGPAEIGPLQTVEFLVRKQDKRGGSGANFILRWSARQPVFEPLVQAVMAGMARGHSVSFVTEGRPLVVPERPLNGEE